MVRNLVLGPLNGIFLLLNIAVFGVKIVALVDAAVRPQRVWRAAVTQSKGLWLAILALALLFGGLGLLGIAALVATIFYFVDVRPKLMEMQGRGRSRY